jgi:hypothetical protein
MKSSLVYLVIAVIVAYIYLNHNVRREGLEPTFGIPPESVQIPIPGAVPGSSGTISPIPTSTAAPTPGPMPSYVTNNPFPPTMTPSGSIPTPMPAFLKQQRMPQGNATCGRCVRGVNPDGSCV